MRLHLEISIIMLDQLDFSSEAIVPQMFCLSFLQVNKCVGELKYSALHLAAELNRPRVVAKLLMYGGDVEVMDAMHRQPLSLTSDYQVRYACVRVHSCNTNISYMPVLDYSYSHYFTDTALVYFYMHNIAHSPSDLLH